MVGEEDQVIGFRRLRELQRALEEDPGTGIIPANAVDDTATNTRTRQQ